jgi:hypothetical protein
MKKQITISVLPLDIKRGKKTHCNKCPVARAIKRHLKRGAATEVCYTSFYLNWGEEVEMYLLPQKAMNFIRGFDDKRKVKPFKFQVNIDEKFLKI